MHAQTIIDAAEDWLRNSQAEDGDATMGDYIFDTPEFVWDVIMQLIQRDLSEEQLALLAAGPLEDLLALHGTHFIDRIEQQAQSSPKFAHLLGGVWRRGMPSEIWDRVERARGSKVW